MENQQLHDVFTGQELEKLEEIARDLGVTPREAANALALAELEKNPMLIGQIRAESERRSGFYRRH